MRILLYVRCKVSYEYEQKLLKSDKINHLAWLLTNTNALKMFNKIGQNMWQLRELKFDFLLENFNIKARVEKKPNYTKILEILALKKKKINVEEINIYHPSLEETQGSNQAKIRKYVNKNSNPNREITSEGDGATKSSEEIETSLIEHEYERLPQINKKKKGLRITRKAEDENTKKYVLEDDSLRTTADVGGEELVRGLEFTSIDKVEEKGELAEFVEVLKLLEKRDNIKKVNIIIGKLPEGKRGKKFARLSDGVTRRKYAIGQVTMMDGGECSLIDVERENRALSMLILKADGKVNWNNIYSKLLIGLVDVSGKWSNEIIKSIEMKEIMVYRKKHINKSIDGIEKQLYKSLI
ncbi:Tn7-like element transposition protein TnsE [Clostridium hydrogenum]|uniref:Tn7-like element transposition protein TnsE n=1 Tax=Clostridium hydrogenum TaxID=2855764 RepID=UPI001F1CDF32|nr:Tn7-like element transposition protein TnsE [Clostridium hydrogenum]